MRRNIFTFLFSAFALCLLADEPQQYSYIDLRGSKIAEVDAYNFVWNDSTGIPTIIDSDYAMMGKGCSLEALSNGDAKLLHFYGDFTIPMHIDLTTGAVTIEACKAIDEIRNIVYVSVDSSGVIMFRPTVWPKMHPDRILPNGSGATGKGFSKIQPETHWTLYAMPLSRLMGIDESDTIHGQVNDDGTISFNDDFVFWVREDVGSRSSWRLSPIFKNLKLLIPNGKHEFDYEHLTPVYSMRHYNRIGPWEGGVGGLVPRPTNTRPGSSKPVSNPNFVGGSPSLNRIIPGDVSDLDDFFLEVQYIDTITHELRPVYMKMVDDTTMMVYNLFGQGNRCYLNLNSNGKIVLPSQQIYNNGLGGVLFNNPSLATWSQNSITWGITTVISNDNLPRFFSNILSPNEDWPFIGSSACYTCKERGDVNNDGTVNVSDVATLIDCLLSGRQDVMTDNNANSNLDQDVSISDVTALIDYLLSGTWAE